MALAIVAHLVGVAALVCAPGFPFALAFLSSKVELDAAQALRVTRALFGGGYVSILAKLLVTTLASLFFVSHRFQELRDAEVEPANPEEWKKLNEEADSGEYADGKKVSNAGEERQDESQISD